MAKNNNEFEYRIRFVFEDSVSDETKRDLSDLCSRLIGKNLKLIGPNHKLNNVLISFYMVLIGVINFFLLDYLDQIVNGTLYDYGLHFSPIWYKPYITVEKTLYVFMGCWILIGITFLAFGIRRVRQVWKYRKLIRKYDPVFIEDQDRKFTKFHTVQVYLNEKRKKYGP